MNQQEKTQVPEFLRSYFWDVTFEELGVKKHAFLIIKRVLDRGNLRDIRWLVATYGKDAIKKVVMETKDLARPTGNFWADMLALDKHQVPCLQKPYSPDTFRAIQLISGVTEIKQAYLAGGTALALQIGHRTSVDLDFFTQHEFNETELSTKLSSLPEFVQDGTAQWTVWGKISQTKLSMFYYKYPLLKPTEKKLHT